MRHLRWIVMPGLLTLAALTFGARDAGPNTENTPRLPSRVRWEPTHDLQVPRPSGLAFSSRSGLFYLGGDANDGTSLLATTTVFKDTLGALQLPVELPAHGQLAYDLKGQRMLLYDPGINAIYSIPEGSDQRLDPARWRQLPPPPLGPTHVTGISADPVTGALYMLDRLTRRVARVVLPPDRDAEKRSVLIDPTWTALELPINAQLGALAWHTGVRRYYVLVNGRQIYEFNERGERLDVIDLDPLTPMHEVSAMVFAPSADQTDASSELNLFLADPGNAEVGTPGHLFEVRLEAQAALPIAPMLAAGELVRTIEAFRWDPPSPDCSGMAWDSIHDRLLVSDGEVNEVSRWAGVNLFEPSRDGTLLRGSDLTGFSNEPTGVAFDPGGRLFFSDDNAREIHVVQLGANMEFDESDLVLSFSTRDFGSGDPEGVGYDVAGDRLFVADGVNNEVYEIHPGPDGEFDGNDVLANQFDTGDAGISDPETVEYNPATGTLYLLSSSRIVEVTTDGVLLTEIDISGVPIDKPAGLCLAPSSNNSGMLSFYLADRAVDNCTSSSENDGLVFEVLAGAFVQATGGPDYSIADGSNDAEESGGSVSLGSSDLDLEPGVTVGLRFPNIAVPQGAKIDTAYLQLAAAESQSAASTLTIRGENTDDSAALSSAGGDLTNRTPTAAAQAWNVPAWSSDEAGLAQRSPPLVDIVEAIVGRPQWASGQALTLLITSTSKRTAHAFEGGTPAVLRIVVKNEAPIVEAGNDTTVALGRGLALQGAIDDALVPPAGALVSEWQQASGLAGVSFTDATDPTTTASFPDLGVYVLRLWGSDGELDASDSLTVTVVPPPPVVVRRIVNDDDDAEEKSSVTVSSGDLDMEEGVLVGVRFRDIDLTAGASIVNAYVQFTADESQSGTTELTVRGQRSANALVFTTTDEDLSTRPTTDSSIVWEPQAWSVGDSGVAQRTPNIAGLIEEIIGLAGWTEGNSLAFLIAGTGKRTAETHDASPGRAALLRVEYAHPSNQAPLVDAGPGRQVLRPDLASLAGSATDDGLPVGTPLSVAWRQVSGPGAASFADSNAAATLAGFPLAGAYVLSLNAADADTAVNDTVTVIVHPNPAPSVDAGPDQDITLPAGTTLDGTIADTTIPQDSALTSVWHLVAGPFDATLGDSNAVDTPVSFADSGTYVFELHASDGDSSAVDSVAIRVRPVPNTAPQVSAGADVTVTMPDAGSLLGDVEDDGLPSGSVLSRAWRFLDGPAAPTFSDSTLNDPLVTFPSAGDYLLALVAFDGEFTVSDSVTVTVQPNVAPLVDAGPDLEISLPDDALLDGTVTDVTIPSGSALTSVWQWISGPFAASVADSESVDTQASFADSGTYRLSLYASDGFLETADTMTVVVRPIPNTEPTVTAGLDTTLTLPDVMTLAGSVADDGLPNGGTLSQAWRLVSGPVEPAFGDSNAVSTGVGFAVPGTYLLGLFADDGELQANATVAITVAPNDPPSVAAGDDQSVTLADLVALAGSVSDANIPQGASLTSVWRLVSGPSTPTLGDSNAVATSATFADSGTYVLSLNASDGDLGAADSMTVHVSGIVIESFSIDVRVDRDQDDAEERTASASVSLSSSDIELVDDAGRNQISGLRFRNVEIPKDATITAAHIQFQADEPDGGGSNVTIYGERSGNANDFTGASGNLSSRTPTGAAQSWQPLPWLSTGDVGARQRTSDLSAVIQEIVSQGTWSEGAALVILFSGSGERTAESHDGNAEAAALLHVEFDVSSGPPPPPPPNTAPTVVAGNDQTITLPANAQLDATVTDDGQPGTTLFPTWSLSSGPATPTFADASSIDGTVGFPTDGTYVLRLDVSDGALTGSDSLTIEVLAPGTTPMTFERRVARGEDDAEERQGSSTNLSSSDLELAVDGSRIQTVGVRFENVTIPRGATIDSAWVQFQTDETPSGVTNLTIRGQTGNALSFTGAAGSVSSRPQTGNSIAWSPPSWDVVGEQGRGQRTPSLAAIIQEIVSRGDWSSGHGLAIIIDGSGTRKAESYDGDASGAPLLHIEYR